MPWFDCYVLHAKLMLIPGRIGRYIQISWDPFVHLETSCARLVGRYCSYLLANQGGGTSQIKVNKTQSTRTWDAM